MSSVLRAGLPTTIALLLLEGTAAAEGAPSKPAQVAMETIARVGDRYVADLEGGGLAELTLNIGLQEAVENVLTGHSVPFGGAVVLSVPDGRVLALAGHSALEPTLGPAELALRPWAPAASVFKVVAAAALVEQGLSATSRACYHGGISAVLPENLVDIRALDRRCDTLGYGIGKSQNAIVAKLAARHLTPERLARAAAAFGFGEILPFDAPLGISEIDVPTEPLEFARTAAGFWHSSLSALHGALIAASIAGAGKMPMARLIERAVGPDGQSVPRARERSRRVIDPRTAAQVGRMMELTTKMGTARAIFRDRRGNRRLPVEVAGKTGSLSYRGAPRDPSLPAATLPNGGYLGYSWFVGYAPAHRPRIAFAVVLGNAAAWRIKAGFVARQLVAEYLAAERDSRGPRVLASR